MTSPSRRPTIADVASEAGVSTGTVSAVINGRATVGADTRDRVRGVIDAMGYRPSQTARALVSGRADTDDRRAVGLVVKEAGNPFYAEVTDGARAFLDERDTVLYTTTSDWSFQKEGDLIETFRDNLFAGVVIAPVLDDDAELDHLFALRRMNFPFVLLDDVKGLKADVVFVDSVEASRLATDHLIELGHERVVHFAGPDYTEHHSRDRVEGVRRAFSESALTFGPDRVVPAGGTSREGYEAGLRVFADAPPGARPTGVMCFNDLVAIGLLRALRELGISVPGDVSVVGYDDIEAAEYAAVPLTTVDVPKRELGRRAAALLLDRIGDGRDRPAQRVALPASLVVRESTRPL
jgi:DNA-binding LacI/PurR family transcriptional regulator